MSSPAAPPPAPPAPAPTLTAAELDRRLAAHARWATAGRFLAAVRTPLAAALLLSGGLTLGARASGVAEGGGEVPLLVLLASTAAAVGSAVWRALSSRIGERNAAAAVDSALRSGGLLMTLAERPVADRPAAWLARLEPRRDRWRDARPRWPLGTLFRSTAVPALFAGLAWALPVESMAGQTTAPADRSAAGDLLTGELADTLAALAAAEGADPAALARAAADLERLRAAVGEGGPTGSQWEAADALRDRMLSAVAEGAADPAAAEAFAGAAAAGADLLAGSGLLESDAVRDAIGGAAAEFAGSDGGPPPTLMEQFASDPQALAELTSEFAGRLDGEQREALADAAAELFAGGSPPEALAALPPGLTAELMAALGTAGGPSAGEILAGPAASAAVRQATAGLPDAVPREVLGAGAAVAGALIPGASAVAGLAERFTPAAPPAGPATTAPGVRPVPEPPAPARAGAVAGRPVPPRLRGVVRRYFSGQTPPPPGPSAPPAG